MKDNTILLVSGVLGLIVLGSTAQLCGNAQLAAVAVGALAGLISGHLNGTEQQKKKEAQP
jgi:hypothetical protein